MAKNDKDRKDFDRWTTNGAGVKVVKKPANNKPKTNKKGK